MKLRPYQLDAIEKVRDAYRAGARSVLLRMETGSGKTHTAAECIRSSVRLGNRVVFAAHLDALLDDTSSRLTKAGIEHGVVQGDRPTNPTAPVQVASLATLHRRQEAPPADFLILDECHRAMAATVRGVLDRYAAADLLGLTATAQRGDGQPLGDVFQAMVQGPSMQQLIDEGHLVPAHVLSPPSPTEGTLARDPVEALEEFAPGQAAMVFCRDAADAADVAARIGDRAVVILGDTPRAVRQDARARLAAGEKLALVGCGVFVEGWDSPAVEAVVLARGFSVCGSYLQACGRSLRPSPETGKTRATIIDLTGAAILHGLPADERLWTLDGEPRRVGDALIQLARCRSCFAVIHAGPSECPRCGASMRGGKVKRRATRIERQELSRLDDRPQAVRDAIALKGIEKRLRSSGRFTEQQIPRIAASIFRKQRGRAA